MNTTEPKPLTRRVLNAATDEAMKSLPPATLDAIFGAGDKAAEETMYAKVREIVAAKGYSTKGL
jgi:hypothetical protein